MDQIKIGKFIAEERKAKKYTQRELADKLIIPGISEPPARTLRATVPENERHIFR